MQESPQEREGIEQFRFLTGLVGLVAFSDVVVELVKLRPMPLVIPLSSWILIASPLAGWGGLVYACWIRSGRITGTALAFVWALGICGMVITEFAFGGPVELWEIVFFTGSWILNGLVIVWIVHKVRRIRAAANTDAADAAR